MTQEGLLTAVCIARMDRTSTLAHRLLWRCETAGEPLFLPLSTTVGGHVKFFRYGTVKNKSTAGCEMSETDTQGRVQLIKERVEFRLDGTRRVQASFEGDSVPGLGMQSEAY